MTTPVACPGCGFVWDETDPATVSAGVTTAANALAHLTRHDPHALDRPTSERWSVAEYAAHLRDVLLSIRDRLVLAAVEDTPSCAPMYRDDRVTLGLYRPEAPGFTADSLRDAATLFANAFDALAPGHGTRHLVYSRMDGQVRTVNWTGAQALHEATHHLGDAEENLRRLRAG